MPFCDDGTMLEDDQFKRLCCLAEEAYGKLELDVSLPKSLGPLLADAGFLNIDCEILKIPIGKWPEDREMQHIGLLQERAIIDFLPTLALRPFNALGMSREKAEMELILGRKALKEKHIHRYFYYYIWCAQKPICEG